MSKIRVITRELARKDFETAFEYYLAEAGSDAAIRLVDAFEAAIENISRHPHSGSTRYAHELGVPNLRTWPIKKFPYLIFYADFESHLEIWRFVHSSRDIPAWLNDPDSIA